MKHGAKLQGGMIMGSMAGTCLMATMAFGNPAMLPEHPGHPMKPLKSPVTGQPTANDPREEVFRGQEALEAATMEGNRDMKLRSRSSLNKQDIDDIGTQSDISRQNESMREQGFGGQSQGEGHSQMGAQNQMGGQDRMTGQGMAQGNQMGNQSQMGGQSSMGGQDQIRSQGESKMNIDEQLNRDDDKVRRPHAGDAGN